MTYQSDCVKKSKKKVDQSVYKTYIRKKFGLTKSEVWEK